jgi:hypothetical protein
MKKSTLLVIIILFAVFVLIGYLLAAKLFTSHQETKLPPTPEAQETLQQKNYLVILVNDLQSKNPELLAIWSVLATESPTDMINFISLFPTVNYSTNDQLVSLFNLRNDSVLTTTSLRRLSRVFDLKTDGYFIIDNAAFLTFAANAGIDQLEVLTETPKALEEVGSIRSSTSEFFNTICDFFSSGAATSFFSKIDWNAAIPAHMESDNTPDEIIGLIDQMSELPDVNTCKVILP